MNGAGQVSRKTSRGRRRAIIIVQLLLAVGLFLGVWLSLRAATDAPSSTVPEQLGGLPLASQVTGPEAVSGMWQMHGGDVGVIDGYIARYGAEGNGATVWLGQAENSSAAEELLQRMTDGIADGNPDFRNLEETVVDGRVVYSVLGGGERHYYYSTTDKVIWLAVDTSQPLDLVKEALRTLE